MNTSTQRISLLAVGIALFVALSMCLQVPVFENYYLCLGYVVMAVYCYSFGTLAGTVVGVFGVILYCLVISGLRGMPGWALGNVAIGLGLGTAFAGTRSVKSAPARYGLRIAAIVLSTAVGILGIKSLVDSIIRSQPFLVRVGMNIYAFVADAAVLILSLPICEKLDSQINTSPEHPSIIP